MKKYLLISSYNWDGDWGITQSLVFNDKNVAQAKMIQLLSYEICDQNNNGNTVVNATEMGNDDLEKEYQKLNGGDLIYWEWSDDSATLAKYGYSSSHHIGWTIQEIEI